ncbi:polysaccharide deacetylase family protein [Patescibacteria group bacterium]|nr:polysaccharide deacetylase family protein [Patescibacteria group bacterium]
MYHKINDLPGNILSVSTAKFEEQVKYLKENYHVVSLKDVINYINRGYTFPDRSVLITFDDGYGDNLTNAYPVLKEYGVKAVLCIPTDFPEGGILPHDEELPIPNPTLSWQEISMMRDVFEIASHGCSHRPLTRMPLTDAKKEIEISKRIIERRLQLAVKAFSYPKGSILDFNDQLEEDVKDSGYQLCFTAIPRKNSGRFNPLRVRRYNVENFGMVYFNCLLGGSTDIISVKDTMIGYKTKAIINNLLTIAKK